MHPSRLRRLLASAARPFEADNPLPSWGLLGPPAMTSAAAINEAGTSSAGLHEVRCTARCFGVIA